MIIKEGNYKEGFLSYYPLKQGLKPHQDTHQDTI